MPRSKFKTILVFSRYGTSFIEQVSLNHISPWLGGGEPVESNGAANGGATTTTPGSAINNLVDT